MCSDVLIALPVGLGHVFVVCKREDWEKVKHSITDTHEVDLEDYEGNTVTLDLYESISNAIVSTYDEDMIGSIFTELDENGIIVFNAMCYANNPDKVLHEEATFCENVMRLIKKWEGRIYDTRAIGLVKSRISFYFRGVLYHVVMDANTSPPTYFFKSDDDEEYIAFSEKYIAEIDAVLTKIPDVIASENIEDETNLQEEEIADLSAFDQAFGTCEEGECECN
jgi:hypothetical protein